MCEDIAIGVVSQILGEFHEALRVIEYATGESEAAGRHGRQARTVVECMIVAVNEPGFDLVHVLRSEAELLADSNGHPGSLCMGRLQIRWERVGSVMKSAKPDLEGVTESIALVFESDDSLGKIVSNFQLMIEALCGCM